MEDANTYEETTKALRKLLTDKDAQQAFKSRFRHSVDEYISALFSKEDCDEIIQSASIIDSDEEVSSQYEDNDVQYISERITRRITIKIETDAKKNKKKDDNVKRVVGKVKGASAIEEPPASNKLPGSTVAISPHSPPKSPKKLEQSPHKSPVRKKKGDPQNWTRPALHEYDSDDEERKSQRLQDKVLKAPKTSAVNLANTALIDMQSFVDKLITKVHFVRPIEHSEEDEDMVEALSEHDLQGEKFLELAASLKENRLSDEQRSDLIRLANTKVSLGKMIQVRCMAVAGKSYLTEFNRFKEGYRAKIPVDILKSNNVKDVSKLKWKRYVKLAYGISYASVKRAIDVFRTCAAFPALCWCEIAPYKLYETNSKYFREVLSNPATYKKLQKKVKDTFNVSTLYTV